MSPEDEKYCSECIHRSKVNRNIACLYITDTGSHRGCPAGVGCDKREIGPTVDRSKIYSVVDPNVRQKQREEHEKRNEMIAYKEDALRRMRVKER